MKQRYLSLDFLRGLTIFGMVFSAILPYGVFPGWMYHVQNPPPLHELDMSRAGIGWVDLVFPVFIFCMGAAIPFAWRGRIEKAGASGCTRSFLKETFVRFLMLWLFSYLYVFLNFSNNTVNGVSPEGTGAQLCTILGFALLFPVYMVLKKERWKNWIRAGGLLAAGLLIAAGHFYFGEVINVQRRGIIIFLLAFLYLFGALFWYFTRDKLYRRVAAFGLILAFTLASQYAGWPVSSYANPGIRWWFNIEYIYFLLLLLPATFAGDILYKRIASGGDIYGELRGRTAHLVFPLLLGLVVWLCYAFYMRLYWANLIVSGSMLLLLWYLIKTRLSQYKVLFVTAAYLLVCGLIIEPLDGGIRKVPCTIQYCLVTCAISILLLMVSDYVCKYVPGSLLVKIFSGAGKNPLMSYIAFDNLVIPVLQLTGLIVLYRAAYPADMPLLGLLRAALAVLFTMWLVSLFTQRKIFWKA